MTGMTYVLIPGAGGAAWYWHLVAAELRQRGHDVVAVDLPADDDTAGLSEYTDTVVGAIGGRTNLVLVAQSMGGFTAPLVCQRLPVSLLVLVNAMIPAPGETAGDWWTNTGQPQAKRDKDLRDGRPADADFDLLTYFFHDVPQHVIDEAWADDRRQSDTPFGQPWPLTAWPDVPTRVIVGSDDRFFPADFQRRVVQDRLGITPDDMPGGHLVALSHPKELADRLEAYQTEAYEERVEMTGTRDDFLSTARSAADLLREPVVAAAWSRPSVLPEFSVGGLAGHLAYQILAVPQALTGPAPQEQTVSLLEHYGRVEWIGAGIDDEINVRIRRGGEAAAAEGPAALAARVDTAVKELTGGLASTADRPVRIPLWGPWSLMLDDMLTTRMMELAVHSDDLAVSVGIATPALPQSAVDTVIDLLSRLAVRRHGPTSVLRALSRAERAPATIAAF